MKEIFDNFNETNEIENLDEIKNSDDISKQFDEFYGDEIKKNNEVLHMGRCPVEGHGGHYNGERGNSNWYFDKDAIPGDRHGTNPEHKTWGEISKQYDVEKISFKDGNPDFSEISKGTVEIDEFSIDRDINFTQADEKLAEIKKCEPEEVEAWRKSNKYTWHECENCRTMQKVPTEVHGNIPHSGGISNAKQKE